MNGAYDFSGIFGEDCFEERIITYTFDIIESNTITLNLLKDRVANWLLNCGYSKLFDSSIIGLHFLAKCTNLSFEDDREYSFCTATFKAYPYKIGNYLEGNWLWDPFVFERDVAQDTCFQVENTELTVMLYNISSHQIFPDFEVKGNMIVEIGQVEYIFTEGIYEKEDIFSLQVGENILKISGNGEINFKWYKEIL